MSTVIVNTLTGTSTAGSISVTGEGNSTTTNLQQGLAKAWGVFNGTGTIAIRDSHNFSSIADTASGRITASINSDMASANYSIGALATDYHVHEKDYNGTDATATLYRLYTFLVSSTNGSTTANEEDRVYAHIFGDLA